MDNYILGNKSKVVVTERSFSSRDQHEFANLSGDFNSIHLDPIHARRTIAGRCVVYGIFGVMWALDSFLSTGRRPPSSIQVNFLKPIFLDERISCVWNDKDLKLELCNDSVVFTEIILSFDTNISPFSVDLKRNPAFKAPFERDLSCIKNIQTQDFFFRGESKLTSSMFQYLSSVYSSETCCEIAAISEVIGMQVPGLHSMLLCMAITFAQSDCSPNFSVKDVHEKFNILKIVVNGGSLRSEVVALLRPQSTKGMSLLSCKYDVNSREFEHVKALVIGGSRGLGECVAKIIALGGGQTLITYALGHEDALNVANDIGEYGGRCSISKLIIPDDLHQLDKLGQFTHIFYFATPKIFGKRGTDYDESTYLQFREIYVDGFKKIVEHFKNSGGKTAIYYPSTIAVSEPIPELAEYIQSKVEGEQLCRDMSDTLTTNILYSRIPRTETDQTMTVAYIEAEKPENVMLPIVRKMANLI